MKKLLAVAALPALVMPVGLAAVLVAATTTSSTTGGAPTQTAIDEIPPLYLVAYQKAAASCPRLPWTILAAIGWVETGHGTFGGASTDDDGTVKPPIVGIALDGTNNTQAVRVPAGGSPWHDDPVWDHAVGPMQFLTDTWARWGVDASGDGVADPHNPIDAIWTAARYLCGPDGTVTSIDDALFAYNRSIAYGVEVKAKAATYGLVTPLAVIPGDAAAVIAHPNLHLDPRARADVEAGLIDARVIAALTTAADHGFVLGVGVMKTGHHPFVRGTSRFSNHWYGRAVDIHSVNGSPVTAANTEAWYLAQLLLSLPQPARPSELGHPWGTDPVLLGQAGSFSDADHTDHLHVGYRATTPEIQHEGYTAP